MDIFGHALQDWQSGRRDRRLTIRRDDDHVDAHDPALYFALDPAAHEVALLRRAKGPVLDVGCGPGRTVLWLERRRIAVTGLDLSPGAVEVARARGCTDVRLGDIMAGGGSHVAGERFRSIILFGNNVGIEARSRAPGSSCADSPT